jgi:hypothetical protein
LHSRHEAHQRRPTRSTSIAPCASAQERLDRAVWAAYGWDDLDPSTVDEETILTRLLALNGERAGAKTA